MTKTFLFRHQNKIAFQKQVTGGEPHIILAEKNNENDSHGTLIKTNHFSVLGMSENESVLILRNLHTQIQILGRDY